MIEYYINRNVRSDATHKGTKPPFEDSSWLVISGCPDKYFWFGGEWVKTEIKNPVECFGLKPLIKPNGGKT